MKVLQKLTISIAAAVLAPAALAAPAAKVDGQKVFAANCASCHAAGVLGAPKASDKAAWATRVKQGKDKLYSNALNGVRMMPPRGGNPSLKDADIKAAVDFMVPKA